MVAYILYVCTNDALISLRDSQDVFSNLQSLSYIFRALISSEFMILQIIFRYVI